MQRTVFRFEGSEQATGSRHIQQGQLIESRNVRQVKRGEYRKRRAFDRAAVAEAFVIGTTTFRRGNSPMSQNQLSVDGLTEGVTATEIILGHTERSNPQTTYNWPQIGASKARVSLTTLISVSTNPVTISFRYGGQSTTVGAVSGTKVGLVVVPVGSNQTIDILSAEFTVPSTVSQLQLTYECPAGSASVTTSSLVVTLVPTGGPQAIMLTDPRTVGLNGTPSLIGQWYVDFDNFASTVTSVKFSLAVCNNAVQFGDGAVTNLRMDGTASATDGTLILTIPNQGGSVFHGASATIARPSGMRLIKIHQNTGGFNGGSALNSVMITAA